MEEQFLNPENLASDETFIAWLEGTDAIHTAYWDKWIREHPEQGEVVQRAIELITELRVTDIHVSDEHTEMARQRLVTAIENARVQQQPATVIPMRRRVLRWASAAAIIGVIAVSIAYFTGRGRQAYNTDFAETKTIVLPDGSQVTLNANSSLRLGNKWTAGDAREVWLEGEGFFSVKHTAQHDKFIVHSRDINVEVLGTEFNLQQRRAKTTVVLHSGKVQLTRNDRSAAAPVIMQPGDLVEFNETARKLEHKKVDSDLYSAWKEGKMIFVNASFSEIIQVLEENYGLRVDTGNVNLDGKQFNGVFPTNNLKVLLNALSSAYDIEAQFNDKEIRLRKQSTK